MVASVLVSYAKARAERFVPSFGGGVLERGERIVILALGGLTGYMRVALWIVAVGAAITVAQRFALAYREMTRLDAATGPGAGEVPQA
jgi:CDP-diacylglycerol--glycerol-3-phosphate 3-phosphatidyltransferase